MKTTKHVSVNAAVLFLLFIIIAAFTSAQAEDEITADYSGWNISDAFADLARKGKLNIVGKFPRSSISHYRLRSKTYIEEAMNLLARSNGMTMRKLGEIWVAVPDAEIKMYQTRATVLRQIELRSAQSLLDTVRLQAMPGISAWCPPHSNAIALSGSKTAVDESKKLIDTLDTPRQTLLITLSLQNATADRTIAACTFLSVSNQQFRLSIKPQTNKAAFNCAGTATINDDGFIRLVLDSTIDPGSNRSDIAQVYLLKSNQKSEHLFNAGDSSLRAIWQIAPVSMRGRLVPINNASMTGHTEVSAAAEISADRPDTSTNKFRHYTEITPLTAPLLTRPITIKNASLADSLQKIANEADTELICDDAITGTISAFCFADRLDRDELIEAMAKACGYDAFKNTTGYVIGKKNEVSSMRLDAESAWISPALIRITAPEAARMLQSWFKEAKITGKITEEGANQLKIIAESTGTGFARSLCAIWARDYAKFSAGLNLQQGSSTAKTELLIREDIPAEAVLKTSNIKVRGRVTAAMTNAEDGLLQIDYQVEAEDKARNRWSLTGSSLLPEEKSISLIRCEGEFPFQLNVSGNFSLRPLFSEPLFEGGTESPATDTFDQSF
ncbi:MAG: hypothetical protein A2W80_00800 [Candidatus Riflebacteria bacterium GWC2_50_8]|nr:MAG: hypothetical protein A2W80_00800 [Candidatus Riflebacteria bacterium GWC2_50_8]